MKIAIRLPGVHLDDLLAITEAADAGGIESVWRGEHIVAPRVIRSTDHYYARSLPPGIERWPSLDPVTLYAFLAARTERVRFGIGASLIALHMPYQLARTVATADIVSGGRMMLAVGIGWMREEYDILGIDWKTRGSRTDEAMAVLRTLWCDPHPQFDGKHFQLPPVSFNPKPIQKPHPPLLIAGFSKFAIRRAARHGDGWYGHDMTAAEVRPIVEMIREERNRLGCSDKPFEFTTRIGHNVAPKDVAAFAAIGIDRLVVDVGTPADDGLGAVIGRVERLAREVVGQS